MTTAENAVQAKSDREKFQVKEEPADEITEQPLAVENVDDEAVERPDPSLEDDDEDFGEFQVLDECVEDEATAKTELTTVAPLTMDKAKTGTSASRKAQPEKTLRSSEKRSAKEREEHKEPATLTRKSTRNITEQKKTDNSRTQQRVTRASASSPKKGSGETSANTKSASKVQSGSAEKAQRQPAQTAKSSPKKGNADGSVSSSMTKSSTADQGGGPVKKQGSPEKKVIKSEEAKEDVAAESELIKQQEENLKESASSAPDGTNSAIIGEEPKLLEQSPSLISKDDNKEQSASLESVDGESNKLPLTTTSSTNEGPDTNITEQGTIHYDNDVLEIAVPLDAWLDDGPRSSSLCMDNDMDSNAVAESCDESKNISFESLDQRDSSSFAIIEANAVKDGNTDISLQETPNMSSNSATPKTANADKSGKATDKNSPSKHDKRNDKSVSSTKSSTKISSNGKSKSPDKKIEKRKECSGTSTRVRSSPAKQPKPDNARAEDKSKTTNKVVEKKVNYGTSSAKENKAAAATSSDKQKESLPPRRTEPLPQVKRYVDSIRNLEYDTKVYCCFYCVACPLLLPTTPRYEEHLNSGMHKQRVAHWRVCQDLQGEELIPSAKRQLDIENFGETIVGADQVVEICTVDGSPCNYICVLCSSSHPDVDTLLSHLTSFLHIENYMERVNSDLFLPPAVPCSQFECRVNDPVHMDEVFSAARIHMMNYGRGTMRSYIGDKYHDVHSAAVEMDEMEETIMMSLMEQVFAGDGSYKTKWTRLDAASSIGNKIYTAQSQDTKEKIIGCRAIVEMWFPDRRIPPVFYCMACNFMVTNINECYKSILENVILEANDETMLKESLVTAVKRVGRLEGGNGRIQNVIQFLADAGVIFCAVNAQIAKQIVEEMGLQFLIPPTPVRRRSRSRRSGASRVEMVPASKNSKQETKTHAGDKRIEKKTSVGTVKPPDGAASSKRDLSSSKTEADSRKIQEKRAADSRARMKVESTKRPEISKTQHTSIRRTVSTRSLERRLQSNSTRSAARHPIMSGRDHRDTLVNRRKAANVREEDRRTRFRFPVPDQPLVSRRQEDYSQRRSLLPKPRSPLLQRPSSREERSRSRKRSPTLESRRREPSPRYSSRRVTSPERQRYHSTIDEQRTRKDTASSKRRSGISREDLRRLTDVMRTYIGLDYGRDLTEEDLDHVQSNFPLGALDELLELVRCTPTMSFHNFFAERAGANPPPIGGEMNWANSARGGDICRTDMADEDFRRRGDGKGDYSRKRHSEGEYSRTRTSLESQRHEQSHRENQKVKKHNDEDHYSRRQDSYRADTRRKHKSPEEDLPVEKKSNINRRPMTPPSYDIDERATGMSLHNPASAVPFMAGGGVQPMSIYDVIRNYENPQPTASLIGNTGVVYAQPFANQTFVPQQPSSAILGGVYGRTQGSDIGNVSYGIPVQNMVNTPILMPVAPQQDIWHDALGATSRSTMHSQQHGNPRDYGRNF